MYHSSMSWEISLLYFFSWNFIWVLQKEPNAVQNFRLLTAQVKFNQICTLIGYFCWKYMFQLKKVWRLYISWYQRVVQNLKKILFFVSKMTRICWILIQALKSLKQVHFDWSLLCKVYNVWSKKVLKSYISWHWRVMQNLRKTDSEFGKWLEEFDKFSPEHTKFWKMGLSLDPFIQSRKCMSLKLKGELCVMTMKNDAKFETELACHFKIDMRNLTNFDPNT